MSDPYRCRFDGHDAIATIADDALLVDAIPVATWLDADIVREADHSVTLVLPTHEVAVTHLGAGFDRFCGELREARGAVRRAALTQSTGVPIDSYLSHDGNAVIDIHLCAGSLVVEPRGGGTTCVPLPSITEVARDGWTVTIRQRVFDPVVVRALGQRTDEFLSDLNRAREPLTGDGWATEGVAPDASRADEVALLTELAGERLRVGTWTDGGRVPMPFVLAPVAGLVAVEATDTDDRATYIFRTDDVERLNAVLVLTTFRREVYSLPDEQLGRWATAVRVLEPVRWLRGAL
ncbi:MAG TPA: hypothetical protein VMK16_10520, partial [Acidimicrobiales bacterium]|nr:hypothetical protein [Acidimicrobiales bacterium]